MKRFMMFLAFIVFAAVNVRAAAFDEFASQIQGKAAAVIETRLNALSADLGAAVSQTSFHQASTIGGTLPGLDVGVHVGYKGVSSKNVILTEAKVSALTLPVLQVEIGIPVINLDVLARYAAIDNSSLTGGGLRYSVFKTIPADVTILGLYNTLNVTASGNEFSATVLTGSLGVNFKLPVVSPYVAVSMDSVTLTPDAAITSYKGSASLTRLDAGINFGLIPFTYINIGGSYYLAEESSVGYRAGMGVKF